MQKVLFLDRDGVINHDPGDYTQSLETFILLPEILDRLKLWYETGYKLVVITNQAGIAKGLYDREEVEKMHQYLQDSAKQKGFDFLAFYYCPHHPEINGKCLCRKPGSVLIEKAIKRFDVDKFNSLMIGDKDRDLVAASSAGIKGFKVNCNGFLPIPEDHYIKQALLKNLLKIDK